MISRFFLLIQLFVFTFSFNINSAQKDSPAPVNTADTIKDQGYRIDKPGTITFTVGVKIKGKLEKPQVMIFLPKEKTVYRELDYSRSFSEDLLDPLSFTPITQ